MFDLLVIKSCVTIVGSKFDSFTTYIYFKPQNWFLGFDFHPKFHLVGSHSKAGTGVNWSGTELFCVNGLMFSQPLVTSGRQDHFPFLSVLSVNPWSDPVNSQAVELCIALTWKAVCLPRAVFAHCYKVILVFLRKLLISFSKPLQNQFCVLNTSQKFMLFWFSACSVLSFVGAFPNDVGTKIRKRFTNDSSHGY